MNNLRALGASPIPRHNEQVKIKEEMPLKTVSGERRQKARKRPPTLIYVELGPANGGMMRDLSEEGFALRAMMPVNPGQVTPFSLLLNEAVRIEGEGEVVWVEDKGRTAGLRFTRISEHARSQIQNWVNHALHSPAPKVADETPVPATQTFDDLRDELRSPKPWREPAASRVTEAPMEPKPRSSPIPAEQTTGAWSGSADEGEEFVARPQADRLPRFPRAQDPSENNSEVAERPAPLEKKPGHWPTSPPLPDISNILIQPPSKVSENAARPFLEPLEPVQANRGRHEARADGFTLSRAVAVMAVLAIIAAAAVYRQRVGESLIWLGEQISGSGPGQVQAPDANDERAKPDNTSQAVGHPPAQESSGASATPGSAPASTQPPPSQSSANDGVTQAPGSAQNSVPAIPQSTPPPVTPLSGMSSEQSTETSQDSGAPEYKQAMELLHGKNGSVDTSEAVRLLWLSVEKGNPNAELSLAELYWHGEGVARNCDQTRILLSAAARKGSPEAQKKLQQFRREGCE